MNTKKKLFLLDAYALIYRAYFAFAKNPRINSQGINTSAVFGFTNTLLEVINKENPTHLAVVFDTKKPTKRHIEYPDYKAHREEMPEGLIQALPYIDKLLEAFNIPKLFHDGFEADDVIGTLAKQAEQEGFQVFMMTPDKDFAQLVSENIFMYKPGNKWQSTTVWGEQEVLEKFQIQRVDQVIDFLAMMGDSSDNIPGILGVGKKTAQKFIADFGSIEGLFQNLHKLKGKIKEKVEKSQEIGMLSKKLVTIITDVPIEFNANKMRVMSKDVEKIKKLFHELEFKTLLERIPEVKSSVVVKTHKKLPSEASQLELFSPPIVNKKNIVFKKKHVMVDSYRQFLKTIEIVSAEEKIALFIFVSRTLSKQEIIGFSITVKNNLTYYIQNNLEYHKLLKELFENPKIKKIGLNIKEMIKSLKTLNIELKGEVFDVQIAHYLLHPEKTHSLELLSEKYLNVELPKKQEEIFSTDLSEEVVADYTSSYSKAIFQLSELLALELEEQNMKKLFNNIEMPLIRVLFQMEFEGITLDLEVLKNYSRELTTELNSLIADIHILANEEFNISSPKQIGEILFKKMNLSKKPKKTKSGQYSTSEETLVKLKGTHPIIDKILEYRAIKKLLSTYVDSLPELVNTLTGRLHTTFNQSVTATGRLSSTNPNIQNIPIRTKRGMKVREAFISKTEEYSLLAADYSQIELRIMASLSRDEGMLKAFNSGADIHTATAAKVYKVDVESVDRNMRSRAKSVNFGIIYGISAFGLSQNIGISRKEAKEMIDQYFDEFPKVKSYMEFLIQEAREQEYVETLMGRKRYLPEINSRNSVIRAFAERNAINTPIQGSAADIIKKAMIEIHNEMINKKMKSKMLLQVHDELVFDAYNIEKEDLKKIVKEKMENVIDLKVPLIVDFGEGKNWLDAH